MFCCVKPQQALLIRVAFNCSNLYLHIEYTPPFGGVYSMAEKEGFEPSIPFWGIHDFQSCALGQLRDFSIKLRYCSQPMYITPFDWICQPLFSQFEPIWKIQLTLGGIMDIMLKPWKLASVAQSVVHLTRNEKVACSSQVTSSNKILTPTGWGFYYSCSCADSKNEIRREWASPATAWRSGTIICKANASESGH